MVDQVERRKNRTKSGVRAKAEHSFGVIKRVFGFVKMRYRGLAKNTHHSLVACAFDQSIHGPPPIAVRLTGVLRLMPA